LTREDLRHAGGYARTVIVCIMVLSSMRRESVGSVNYLRKTRPGPSAMSLRPEPQRGRCFVSPPANVRKGGPLDGEDGRRKKNACQLHPALALVVWVVVLVCLVVLIRLGYDSASAIGVIGAATALAIQVIRLLAPHHRPAAGEA
jgi:hypothetical protein